MSIFITCYIHCYCSMYVSVKCGSTELVTFKLLNVICNMYCHNVLFYVVYFVGLLRPRVRRFMLIDRFVSG